MDLLTPCFIIDKDDLKNNIDNMHKALKDTWKNYIIGYSCKTNSLRWIMNFLKNNGCYAEVVSEFEYKLAKHIGYDEKNIIFNGPNKGREAFINAIRNNSIVNIDSWREIEWLEREYFNENVKVGLRINFNLEKECPNETSVGDKGSRFGINLENGDLKKAIEKINELKNISIVGIHLHSTSKTRSINIYKKLAKKACEIADMFDYDLNYIDIGGGFFGGLIDKPSYHDYMTIITEELEKRFNKEKTKLIVEPGNALIASPISFLCEVVDVKDTFTQRIVTLNGSRNNVDPLMRKKSYFYETLTENKNTLSKQTLAGYTCLENDIFMEILDKPELKVGDKILFNKVGAYTMSLSPLFIECFPSIYLKNYNNDFRCIRKKWGVDEYIQKSYI